MATIHIQRSPYPLFAFEWVFVVKRNRWVLFLHAYPVDAHRN